MPLKGILRPTEGALAGEGALKNPEMSGLRALAFSARCLLASNLPRGGARGGKEAAGRAGLAGVGPAGGARGRPYCLKGSRSVEGEFVRVVAICSHLGPNSPPGTLS
jgi:hypothetical protein